LQVLQVLQVRLVLLRHRASQVPPPLRRQFVAGLQRWSRPCPRWRSCSKYPVVVELVVVVLKARVDLVVVAAADVLVVRKWRS
jgi:hypothetical protein